MKQRRAICFNFKAHVATSVNSSRLVIHNKRLTVQSAIRKDRREALLIIEMHVGKSFMFHHGRDNEVLLIRNVKLLLLLDVQIT